MTREHFETFCSANFVTNNEHILSTFSILKIVKKILTVQFWRFFDPVSHLNLLEILPQSQNPCHPSSQIFSDLPTFRPHAALKGQCHEIFCLWFFPWINVPPAPEYPIRTVSNIFENLQRYSQVKVHHPVSTTRKNLKRPLCYTQGLGGKLIHEKNLVTLSL